LSLIHMETGSGNTDNDLMKAAQEGDIRAFEHLVERRRNQMVSFFYRLTRRVDKAEELAQEVFLKIYLSRADYRPKVKFTTFLYTVGRNAWIDLLKKESKGGKQVSLSARNAGELGLEDMIASSDKTPLAELKEDETAQLIVDAIDSLPEEQKIVFVLSEVDGMRYADISENLGIPLGTVKSRMHNAIKKLRKKLKRIESARMRKERLKNQ